MTFELRRRFTVQAAHWLPNVERGHSCGRLHGHTYIIEVRVTGEARDPEGWVMDYAEVDRAFEPLRAQLDHTCLNDVEGLTNPTSERIAEWIWDRLAPKLSGLAAVSVAENDRSSCTYRPQGL